MNEPKMKPIWFFVGLILMLVGGLIFISGIYQLIVPPTKITVLGETHPNIWWGIVMVAFGGLLYFKTRNETV